MGAARAPVSNKVVNNPEYRYGGVDPNLGTFS